MEDNSTAHQQNYPEQKVETDQTPTAQSTDQHHPPSLGLEPPEEAVKKDTSSDEEKNHAGKNVYLSLLFIKVPVAQSFCNAGLHNNRLCSN